MTKQLLALIAPLVAAASGCVVVDRDPPPDPIGDIAFDWSFNGEPDCDFAGVDELDIAIFRDGQLFDEIDGEPCVGGGLVLTDFFNDRYELEIDAYSRDNILLYSGGFSIRVEGGVENDAGVVVLAPINAQVEPRVETGSLGFFWTFLYPAQSAIESCRIAGVDEIDVELESDDGEIVRDTFTCENAAGATFDNLREGNWTLNLDAYGRYHGESIHLYGATVATAVFANDLVEAGEIALPRDEESFADVEAVWDFTGTSCGVEGITELTLAVQRNGHDTAEDVTTVQCTSLSALRRTFVPGSYTVSLVGNGSNDTFIAFSSIDIGPDTTTQVALHLAPDAR